MQYFDPAASVAQRKSFGETFAPYVGMANQLQSIEASRASTANTKAQLPGITAAAAEQERVAARNKDIQDTLGRNKKGGRFDMDAAAQDLFNKGYLEEGMQLYKDKLSTDVESFKRDLAAVRSPLEQAQLKVDFEKNYIEQGAKLAAKLPPGTKPGQREYFMATHIDKGLEQGLVRGASPLLKTLDAKPEAATNLASELTPEQKVAFDDERARTGADVRTQPEAPLNRSVRSDIAAQGVQVPEGVTAFNKEQFPGLSDAVSTSRTGGVLPAGARGQAAVDANALKAAVEDNLRVLGKYSAIRDKQVLGTRIGTLAGDAYERFIKTNPQLAGWEADVSAYNTRNPTDPITKSMSFGEGLKKIDAETARLNIQTRSKEKTAGQVKTAPAGKDVLMTDGKRTFRIPADRVDEAKADGLRVK